MKKFYYTLILLLTVCAGCYAQSAQSDSLYARGVDLYQQRDYAEALKYFSQSDALDKAQLDSMSSRRGYSAGWMASCYYRLGDEANAIKYDRYQYKFRPIDRRQTIAMDSVMDSAMPDLMNNRHLPALEKLKSLSVLEHEAFGPDHYVHIMTDRYLAMCHINLRQIEDALPYIEDACRLIRHNYSELDTLQIPELLNLINIYAGRMQYDKADAIFKDYASVVKANFGERHPEYSNMRYTEIALMLAQRKWDEAKRLLPEYIGVLDGCFGENPESLKSCILTVRHLFAQCGRNEECAYIDRRSESLLKNSSALETFNKQALALSGDIRLKRDDEVYVGFIKLEESLEHLPAGNVRQCRAILECLRCLHAMSDNRLDEAKDRYLRMEENGYEDAFQDKEFAPIYLSMKSTMCLLLSDYEGAAQAMDKTVEMSESMNWDTLDMKGYQASVNAMAGKFDKAKEITSNTVRQWKENVIDNKALYRLEKDTACINRILTIFDTHIRISENMTDSVRYTLREIKSEFLLLKADMLQNLTHYQINRDYYECISDYAFELVRMKKYPEAQAVMDSWLADWKKTFDTLDMDTEVESEKWKIVDAMFTVEDALEFRCHHCYEPKDPAGVKAYEDLLEYDRREFAEGENSDVYISDKIRYFQFLKDNRGLIDYLTPIVDSDSKDNEDEWYRTVSEAYESEGDPKNSNRYRERYIRRLIANSVQLVRNEKNIFNSIDRVIDYYTTEEKDTARILEFYASALWPALDTGADLRYRYFIKSINALAFDICDDSFIPYVERELERSFAFIQTPYQKACLYDAMAGVLANGRKNMQLALEYIDKARGLVAHEATLNLLFGCHKHKILKKINTGECRNKAIGLGWELIEEFNRTDSMRNSSEYLCLVERQVEMLKESERLDELMRLGKEYLGYRENHGSGPEVYLLKDGAPGGKEIDLVRENVLQDYTWFPDESVRKMLYEAYSVKDPAEASKYALNIIAAEFGHLRTSMDVNSVYSWQCDNLISNTSRLAYRYRTVPLKNYAYDAALACKGLQMQSNKAVRALIKKSGHKGALRKFDDLEAVMNKMAVSSGAALDSLLIRRNELENDLHRLSRNFGDYKNAIFTSWTKVQSALGDNDLAVEITYVSPDYGRDSWNGDNGYFACVLRKNMPGPDIVFVENKDSVSTGTDVYKSTKLSKALLGALKPYLKGIKNIYYSPIGAFNQIAVESLPLTDDLKHTLASRYNLYRVSSTRQLFEGDMYVTGENAVVYGGLKYDATVDDLREDARKYSRGLMPEEEQSAEVDMRSLRGLVKKLPYLSGTASEASSVVERINAASDTGLRAVPMIGADGTEASFKSLGGKQTRIIHLATHGFYFDERKFKSLTNTRDERNGEMKQEDKSLMRSGLFMAGSDNAYQGRELPSGLDDGILTSHEIANIDLTGLDLCVLSACQTAQGDISS